LKEDRACLIQKLDPPGPLIHSGAPHKEAEAQDKDSLQRTEPQVLEEPHLITVAGTSTPITREIKFRQEEVRQIFLLILSIKT